jgi:hypothetical protein
MSGAGASLTPWLDLAAVGDEAAQKGHILIVNIVDLVHAKATHLAMGDVFWLAALSAGPGWFPGGPFHYSFGQVIAPEIELIELDLGPD